MKLDFEKPTTTVPNFIKTKQGMIPIEQLSEEELTEYAELWTEALRQKYERRKHES